MPVYEEITTQRYTEKVLNLIEKLETRDDDLRAEVLTYLKKWHYPGQHMTHTFDTPIKESRHPVPYEHVIKDDEGYVLVWSPHADTLTLYYRIPEESV